MRPQRQGLYDPQTERDACGVGFVANIKGDRSHAIVEQGLEILQRLEHRGACGCDPETGDGAGILVQMPHAFFRRIAEEQGWGELRRRRYGVGMVFLPADPAGQLACQEILDDVIAEEGQELIGWRDVPVVPESIGWLAREAMPRIRQVFIGLKSLVPSAYERKLYVIRKLAENRIRERGVDPGGVFHVPSLSTNTIVYKGLLLPDQLPAFYPDLTAADFTSAIALVHSRFSTNTFPTWDLAQPFRFMCHNGEINTVRGNANWTRARRSQMQSAKFEGKLKDLFPIINPDKSDSAQFDNMLELLHLAGRSLPHAAMLMIPEAWEHDTLMDEERRAFYDYASSLMEPWDGPAAVCFTDGSLIGATLDRNGLRPARYTITTDDRVILSSETGVIDIDPAMVRRKGRLQPGRIFVVDTEEGRVLSDDDVKNEIVRRWPYRRWLEHNEFTLDDFPATEAEKPLSGRELTLQQRAFGWTDEDTRVIVAPMAEQGEEPTGSMGDDAPLAVLSEMAPPLFNYFRQLFAQVTNPPIDPIREELVMSVSTAIGQGANCLDETPELCHRVIVPGPVITNDELARIEKSLGDGDGMFDPVRVSILYDAARAESGLEQAVQDLCDHVVQLVKEGRNVIVLSDRGVTPRMLPIPSLLAVSAVHQRLVREGTRMETGLLLETAEAREVHHFAVLLGFGCAAINPYLVFDTIRSMAADGTIRVDAETGIRNYIKATNKGLKKVMSKMGISTVQSYRGAQIFEAVGVSRAVIDTHFGGCASRIEGVGFEELGREALIRHQRAWGEQVPFEWEDLPVGGHYQWRRRGELHKWNPATIAKLQAATRANDAATWKEYTDLITDEDEQLMTLRGLLEFDTDAIQPVPLDEVESEEAIMSRFCTGAMSLGSISPQAESPYGIRVNAGWRVPFTGLLCKEPPYGGIAAIDLNTREMLWDRPFGTARKNGPFGIPSMLPVDIGTPNNGGGFITASGLFFIGAATDDLFRAIDIETGERVWEMELPAGGQATPMTYESQGRQIVVINAGGHDFMETPIGDYFIAYALPGGGTAEGAGDVQP